MAKKIILEDQLDQINGTLNEQLTKSNMSYAGISEEMQNISTHLSTQNGILAQMYATMLPDEVRWKDIQLAVRNGAAPLIYPVGTQIVAKWVDKSNNNKEYQMPYDIVHYGRAELEDGEIIDNAMFLESHYTLPHDMQFGHERAFLRCPDGLAAGTYYFTYVGSKWGNNVKPGTVVCFRLTQDLPAGGRIAGCYGAPDQTMDKWRIYSYSDAKTLLETVTPSFEIADDATNLGDMQYSTRNGNLNSMQEMVYGWNRYSTSALRQYLNSSADKGTWWVEADGWDIRPNQLDTKPGFLSGVEGEFLEIITPTKIRTAANTVQDKTDIGAEYEDTYDEFFIASIEQEYISPQIAGVEGEYWEYWKRRLGLTKPQGWYVENLNPRHIRYALNAQSSPQGVRLRSANRGYACFAWYVGRTGSVGSYGASDGIRACPACVITGR